jgi:hypothetical protein
VTKSKRYAHQFLHNNTKLSPGARTGNLSYITLGEIKGFVSILINIIRHPTVASCWFINDSEHFPWFSNMLSHNRFLFILKCFHSVDNINLADPRVSAYDPCTEEADQM